MNNFSAFKLFYDELIYKRTGFVPFANVFDLLNNIKDNVEKVRKYSKTDVNEYMANLKKRNKAIRADLEEILKKNRSLMQLYFLMYKARLDICNDKLEDMPLIISNSFYNDYRLDNKTALELEMNNNTIPKYSSLEKKEMREKASQMQALDYFIELLEYSEDNKKYRTFINKVNEAKEMLPLYKESHFIYFSRLEPVIENLCKLVPKIEEKAKLSDDYEDMSLRMKIAYKDKFDDWSLGVKKIINDYFDSLFNKKENDALIRKHFNVVNEISYSTYLEILREINEEYDELTLMYNHGDYEPVSYYGESYLFRIREVLINSYFDKRFLVKPIKGNLESYVNVAINLYSLAVDLEDSILDYYIYLASHSKALRRNNDVESAILENLFELYSPLKLLDKFEILRKDFAAMLAKESNSFKKKYNVMLLDKRVEFSFKGPIPNRAAIKILVTDRCKSFIVENCLDNLINFDVTNMYDTRNYDFSVLCENFSFDDIIELYSSLKEVYSNFPKALPIPQRFIVEVLYNRTQIEQLSDNDRKEKMKAICYSYLNEEPLFLE